MQFEPWHMAKMVKKISEGIDFDLMQEKRSFERTKLHWTSTIRSVYVAGVPLKIELDKKSYEELLKNVMLQKDEVVKENEAQDWI